MHIISQTMSYFSVVFVKRIRYGKIRAFVFDPAHGRIFVTVSIS